MRYFRVFCRFNPRTRKWIVTGCSPRWGYVPPMAIHCRREIGICTIRQQRLRAAVSPHRLHMEAYRDAHRKKKKPAWAGIDLATGADRGVVVLWPENIELRSGHGTR